jgi:GTPase involved in cell partitioning and DNA repair
VEDINWKADSKGLPGQQMSLQLLLRVVADVGLVGFPNAGGCGVWGAVAGRLLRAVSRSASQPARHTRATHSPLLAAVSSGKSSLLGALTRASPEVAPYPFTTLMPNLGVLAAGGQAPVLAAGGQAPVLADLPGLIEGEFFVGGVVRASTGGVCRQPWCARQQPHSS